MWTFRLPNDNGVSSAFNNGITIKTRAKTIEQKIDARAIRKSVLEIPKNCVHTVSRLISKL